MISFISGGQKNTWSKKEGNRLTKVITNFGEQGTDKINILSLGKRENPKIFWETMEQVPPRPTPTHTREGLINEALPGVGGTCSLVPLENRHFPQNQNLKFPKLPLFHSVLDFCSLVHLT